MHDGVEQTVGGHRHPGQLVQVDVLVQRQDGGEAPRPEKRDTLAQHEHQDEGTVKVETLSCGSSWGETRKQDDGRLHRT